MSKALMTKDWPDMVIEAHMKGYITKTHLKSLLSLLPDMETTFDGTMDSVYRMTEKLMEHVKNFQMTLPNDGSMAEAVGNQILIEMVKTGGALIRQAMGLVEGAF